MIWYMDILQNDSHNKTSLFLKHYLAFPASLWPLSRNEKLASLLALITIPHIVLGFHLLFPDRGLFGQSVYIPLQVISPISFPLLAAPSTDSILVNTAGFTALRKTFGYLSPIKFHPDKEGVCEF